MDDALVALHVVGVRVEMPRNQPVLILRGDDDDTDHLHVAVVVGPAEAAAVARALQGDIPVRPMTHDLLTSVLESLGGGVRAVEIRLLDSSTYAGTITLEDGQLIDARASDAVAVAVRAHCQISMRRSTLEAVSIPTGASSDSAASQRAVSGSPEAEGVASRGPISADEIAEFERFLARAEPEDFDQT